MWGLVFHRKDFEKKYSVRSVESVSRAILGSASALAFSSPTARPPRSVTSVTVSGLRLVWMKQSPAGAGHVQLLLPASLAQSHGQTHRHAEKAVPAPP